MNKKIELGLSLYSLSGDFITGKRDMTGCLALAHELGYRGIEIVAAQSVPEYPFPSDKWIGEFRENLDRFGLEPVCYSAYIDSGLRNDRDLSYDEIEQFTVNDLMIAKKVGFKMVRTQHGILPERLEKMIPKCKDLDMMLTVELHQPHTPEVPVWQEYLELMNNKGKGCLGVVPDFSIFQEYPHKLHLDALHEGGFREDKLEEILKLFRQGAKLEDCAGLGLDDDEMECAGEIFHGYAPAKLEWLEQLLPVTPYIHGKFYHIEKSAGKDASIPIQELITRIKELGYEGFIAAEYEGHQFSLHIDEREQLEQFAQIFNNALS